MAKKVDLAEKNSDYFLIMRESPLAKPKGKANSLSDEFTPSVFQLLIAAFFTAVIITITRMHTYQRPMGEFYWSPGSAEEMTTLTDFFSYYKMIAILFCGILAVFVILYYVFCQTLAIRKSYAYIPMGIYSLFVLISYFASDYKEFSLYGYNDRFEGTIPVLIYMLMLFYIINLVTSEKSVKWILYPLAVVSGILGLLGLTQVLDIDFFRTGFGKRLITPPSYWEHVDQLVFTFQNKEIYQTVYNINYVSFYLTLLIPLFAMLFIREHDVKKKIAWGALFTLLFYNIIGAQSSGGIMGLAATIIMAFIVLNKRLWQWKKSVAILLVIMIAVSAGTFTRFAPELFNAVNSVLGKQVLSIPGQSKQTAESDDKEPVSTPQRTYIDYIDVQKEGVVFKLNGEVMVLSLVTPSDPQNSEILLTDIDGNVVEYTLKEDNSGYEVVDPRFDMCTIQPANDEEGNFYVLVTIDEMQWAFRAQDEGLKYMNQLGKEVDLVNVPHVGFEDNQSFGSGRGYIWSRTFPMMLDTFIIGHGADTYCLYFPHKDYPGKYNSGTFSGNVNIVVDKPHNLYMGMFVGTGGISVLAFLALILLYILQSIRLYFKLDFADGFLPAAGVGIFLGVCGFMAAAIVNDSSVSVMPMFYGLLGTGIAINYMIKKRCAQ